MTLFTDGNTTVVLEKVCAYLYEKRQSAPGEKEVVTLQVFLEGGHTFTLHRQGAIHAFTQALKSLAENGP